MCNLLIINLPPAKNDTTPQQIGAVCTEFIEGDVRPFEIPDHNVQRSNALKGGQENRKKTAPATAFLYEVAETMDLWVPGFGKKELQNSGAWWRRCFNQNPKKARRVLADTFTEIKEGRSFSKNPGARSVDLWKRLPL